LRRLAESYRMLARPIARQREDDNRHFDVVVTGSTYMSYFEEVCEPILLGRDDAIGIMYLDGDPAAAAVGAAPVPRMADSTGFALGCRSALLISRRSSGSAGRGADRHGHIRRRGYRKK